MSWVLKARLKLNEGTHRKLHRVNKKVNFTMPKYVTIALTLLGSRTNTLHMSFDEMESSMEHDMWSQAPDSTI